MEEIEASLSCRLSDLNSTARSRSFICEGGGKEGWGAKGRGEKRGERAKSGTTRPGRGCAFSTGRKGRGSEAGGREIQERS